MVTALWIAQIFLAGIFVFSGTLKSTMSRERMQATGQTGAAAYPLPVVRFTAVCELLAAVGLIVPWLTRPRCRFGARVLVPARLDGHNLVRGSLSFEV